MAEITQYHCTSCDHTWVPRTPSPKKCPRCQSFGTIETVGRPKNPNARQFVEATSDDELKTLRDVLQILREDFQGCRARIMDMVGMFQMARKRSEGSGQKVASR